MKNVRSSILWKYAVHFCRPACVPVEDLPGNSLLLLFWINVFHEAITLTSRHVEVTSRVLRCCGRKDAKRKTQIYGLIEQFVFLLGDLQPLGQRRPRWPHMTRGDPCRGILGSFPLLTSSTPGVPLMCSCCLFTYRPARHCGLVTLQRQPSNLPLHASSAGSPSSANTLFSSGRPLIHAALAPSPDLALYFWTLLLLIHASLHLRDDKLSRFSPSQESSFCHTCNFVASLCRCTLFF